MLRYLRNKLRKPTALEEAATELEEARCSLLREQTRAEYAIAEAEKHGARAKFNRQRIVRLQAYINDETKQAA